MVLHRLLQGIACGNPGVHALEPTQAPLHIDDAPIIFVVVDPLRVGKKENGWLIVNMRCDVNEPVTFIPNSMMFGFDEDRRRREPSAA